MRILCTSIVGKYAVAVVRVTVVMDLASVLLQNKIL